MKAVLQKVRPVKPETVINQISKEIRKRRAKADIKLVERAFELASRVHEGQLSKSGDPFITHPLGVAMILAEIGLDEATVAAAFGGMRPAHALGYVSCCSQHRSPACEPY